MLPISYGPLTFQGGGGTGGGLKYKGSVAFENLPTTGQEEGDMYNITNDFILGGKHYVAGTNVAWTGTEWDALGGGTAVQSVNSKTGAVVLNAGDILATNTQSVQANLERIDEELGIRQVLINIEEFPEELDVDFLYRVDIEFTHSGKTYGVGLYQVVDDDLVLIGAGGEAGDKLNFHIIDDAKIAEMKTKWEPTRSGAGVSGYSLFKEYGCGLFKFDVEGNVNLYTSPNSSTSIIKDGTIIFLYQSGNNMFVIPYISSTGLNYYTTRTWTDLSSNYSYTGVSKDGSDLLNFLNININNYLAKNNTTEFIPTDDYNPSPKKYVDDKANEWVNDGFLYDNKVTGLTTYANYGTSYGFDTDSDGFRSATNTNIANSWALGKITINNTTGSDVYLDLEYDVNTSYLYVSKVDTEFPDNDTTPSSSVRSYQLYGFYPAGEHKHVQLLIPAGEHFVTIKYIGSQKSPNYYMKFKETIIVPQNRHLSTKEDFTDYIGYDATKTQVLKNVNGVLTWITEE